MLHADVARCACAQWVNKLPNDHLFLVDKFIPHMPTNMGLGDSLPTPLNGVNADIALPNGLRDGLGSQGRAVVHVHGGCAAQRRHARTLALPAR